MAVYLLTRPDVTLVAAVLAIGFATTFYGVLQIATAFEVKSLPSRFDALTKQTDATPDRPLESVA